jgi:hypothetical protein
MIIDWNQVCMSGRQMKLWEGMVTKVVGWMDGNRGRLPEKMDRDPEDEAERAERGAARTLERLREAQEELHADAPYLFTLLEEVTLAKHVVPISNCCSSRAVGASL